VSSKIGTKMAEKSNTVLRGITRPKILLKLTNILSKVGVKMGSYVPQAGIKAASKAATVAAKVGKALSKGGFVVFDLISLSLDLADPRGFDTMRTKSFYLGLKASNQKTFNESILNEGGNLVVGPLDFVSQEQTDKAVDIAIDAILQDIIGQIIVEILQNDMSEEDIEWYVNRELDNISETDVVNKVMEKLCVDANGIYFEDGTCSLKRTECHAYPWPLTDSPDVSTVFTRRFVNGKCVMEDPSARLLCDEDGMVYNHDTGMCEISSLYCKNKGAEWKYDPLISDYDCHVSGLQQALEFVFGKTIVRSITSA
jgi:hypothetical protein